MENTVNILIFLYFLSCCADRIFNMLYGNMKKTKIRDSLFLLPLLFIYLCCKQVLCVNRCGKSVRFTKCGNEQAASHRKKYCEKPFRHPIELRLSLVTFHTLAYFYVSFTHSRFNLFVIMPLHLYPLSMLAASDTRKIPSKLLTEHRHYLNDESTRNIKKIGFNRIKKT